jgi:intracellular septation protein A
MTSYSLILGLIPLIIFVILDSFASTKTALVGAIVFALLETIFTLYLFKTIDEVTIFSFVLVVILAFISYKSSNKLWFKFQPVILSIGIGIYLIGTYYLGSPVLYEMSMKYINFFPIELRYQILHPMMQLILKKATQTVGFAFLIHAVFTAICAVKLSNIWWLIMRSIGFYLFMFLGLLVARFLI